MYKIGQKTHGRIILLNTDSSIKLIFHIFGLNIAFDCNICIRKHSLEVFYIEWK